MSFRITVESGIVTGTYRIFMAFFPHRRRGFMAEISCKHYTSTDLYSDLVYGYVMVWWLGASQIICHSYFWCFLKQAHCDTSMLFNVAFLACTSFESFLVLLLESQPKCALVASWHMFERRPSTWVCQWSINHCTQIPESNNATVSWPQALGYVSRYT